MRSSGSRSEQRLLCVRLRSLDASRGGGEPGTVIGETAREGKAPHSRRGEINPARRLYERLGFTLTHEDHNKFYIGVSQIGRPHDRRAFLRPDRCGARHLDGASLRNDRKGPLFRTIGRGTGLLSRTVLLQANAYAMIRRRAAAAGIETKLGSHSFRVTGITA